MKIVKSSRHSKITGDFGERLVLYWLSKHGFECALVDHVGIDIIARNPHTSELMGISVKSRSRVQGRQDSTLNVPAKNLGHVQAACKAFGCISYFAIVVDAPEVINVFIVSTQRLIVLCPPIKSYVYWRMRKYDLDRYGKDPDIRWFSFMTTGHTWWT